MLSCTNTPHETHKNTAIQPRDCDILITTPIITLPHRRHQCFPTFFSRNRPGDSYSDPLALWRPLSLSRTLSTWEIINKNIERKNGITRRGEAATRLQRNSKIARSSDTCLKSVATSISLCYSQLSPNHFLIFTSKRNSARSSSSVTNCSACYFCTVNAIKNTVRRRKYNNGTRSNKNDKRYGMQVGKEEQKKTREAIVATRSIM